MWLRPFFHHRNYLKVKGMPILMVYELSPGTAHVVRRLKELALLDGFPGLHCTVGTYGSSDVLFPPSEHRGARENQAQHPTPSLDGENAVFDRLTHYPRSYGWMRELSYKAPLWCLKRSTQAQPRSPNVVGIVTAFDDTPRRGLKDARIWAGRDKNVRRQKSVLFQRSLWAAMFYHACCYVEGGKDQFILVNAWNEWGEGMVMEPSSLYGREFLDALQKTKRTFRGTCPWPVPGSRKAS